MPDRYFLRSKLLAGANAERDKPRFQKISAAEWEDIFDRCKWREPVYAWLWANVDQVTKARQHRGDWNRIEWREIARIMELDGVVGSRGEPPNANSVRRVWGRVVKDLEKQEAYDEAQRVAKRRRS